MAINLSTFWSEWGVVSGNTQATNQYEFWNGMKMSNGQILASQYDFFTYHNTTRYEWFKNLQSTYPEVYDEYTFYRNTSDNRIYDYRTFYEFGGQYLSPSGITPTPTPTLTKTPTPTSTPTPTPTKTPTPTPSSSGDADATAYLSAVVSNGGSVDGTITSAVNNLFSSLKSAGIYNKLIAMYPVIGGVANSHALNALSPSLADSYALEFFGTWTHTSSGMNTNNSLISNRAETGIIPNVLFSDGQYSYGVYVNSNPEVNDEYALGSYVNGENASAIEFLPSAIKYYITPSNTSLTSLVTNQGFLQLSISTTNGDARFSNSIETKTGSFARANTNIPSVEFYLSNLNLNGTPYNSNPVRNCFTYFSNYLTPTELGTFSSIVQDFQTTLSRQI